MMTLWQGTASSVLVEGGGEWFSWVTNHKRCFLLYLLAYKIRISLTHCKPIFPYAPCWPVFFVFFFKGAAHGQKPLVSMFHWPSERSKLHRRAWLQWHRQCQRHHGNKRTTWSQKSLATGAIRFSWLDKLRQTWCFADILYQCWINDGSSNHSTTRQHLRLLHILHICIYFVSSHNSRITRVEILIPMETKHLLKRKPVHVQRALQEALHLLNQGRLKGVLAVNSQLLWLPLAPGVGRLRCRQRGGCSRKCFLIFPRCVETTEAGF